jgi:lipopolysaccharide export system protein LptC
VPMERTTTHASDIATGAMGIPSREDVAARYAVAQRHSRRVRLLRFGIPVGSALAVTALVLVAIFDPFRSIPAGVSIEAFRLSGSKITMELPRLTGFRQDMRPYEVTADSAVQDVRNPAVIELSVMRAKIGMEERRTALLEAVRGVYDSQKETLDLREDVRVIAEGYDVHMKSARVDMKAGTVLTDDPVRVLMSGGSIEADAMHIMDNGKKIVFIGRVTTHLSSAPDEKPAASRGATEGTR